jgi:hypothetical protein
MSSRDPQNEIHLKHYILQTERYLARRKMSLVVLYEGPKSCFLKKKLFVRIICTRLEYIRGHRYTRTRAGRGFRVIDSPKTAAEIRMNRIILPSHDS